MNDFHEKLRRILENGSVREEEPMKNHTTFRIGGPAAYYVIPGTEEEFIRVADLCREENMPFCVIGNGSNLLVRDEGYGGVILSTECLTSWEICLNDSQGPEGNMRISEEIQEAEGKTVSALAGILLSRLAKAAAAEGLTGLEFAAGIPGTLGGAVVMNAGAYGSEMKDVLCWVRVLDRDGKVKTLAADELELGYRTSCIARKEYVVLAAGLRLHKGQQETIYKKMEELAARRREKQPLEYPSAGSTFKRPAGYFAGKLIEEAGLRGFRIGDAQVSEKHCGFVVNRGNATAADVIKLCGEVRRRVKESFGVDLEPEIKQL